MQEGGTMNMEAAESSKTFLLTYQLVCTTLQKTVISVFLLVKVCAFIFSHKRLLSFFLLCAVIAVYLLAHKP
jgi:hypothetical protein